MELFKLLGKISIDNTGANKAIEETTDKAKESEGNLKETFSKIGGVMKTFATGVGIAGSALVAVAESTREYRTEMGKLDTAFVTSGHSSKSAKKTYSELNAILGDTGQAVEAANHLAKLTENEKELETWTSICTGVYATFGASLPIEGLTEAANETAKVGQVTGSLADALNWAGVSEDDFNKKLSSCTTEQERQQLIMETLNGIYKDASEQYKETNADILAATKAQERLTNIMAKFGEIGEPVLTGFKNVIADIGEAALPVIENVIVGVQNMVKWFKEHEGLVTFLASAFGVFTTALIAYTIAENAATIATTAHAAATTIATTATTAFGAATAFLTSPVTLAVAAIAGLIAIGVALYKNWDVVTEKATELWKKIKEVFENIKTVVIDKFEKLKDSTGKIAEAMMKSVLNRFTSGFRLINSLTDGKLSEVVKSFKSKFDKAKEIVKQAIDKIKGFFNFKWELPKLKMPHFKINGKFSLDPPSVPSIGVEWYAKAMNNPMIMNQPTAFGINSSGQIMAGGEAGSEVVSGTETLMNMIGAVVAAQNGELVETFNDNFMKLMSFLTQYIPELANMKLVLDSGKLVGELTPAMDAQLGQILKMRARGI